MLALTRAMIRDDGLHPGTSKRGRPQVFVYFDAEGGSTGLKEALDAITALPVRRQLTRKQKARGEATDQVQSLFLFCKRDGQRYTIEGFQSNWQRRMNAFVQEVEGAERFWEHDIRASAGNAADEHRRWHARIRIAARTLSAGNDESLPERTCCGEGLASPTTEKMSRLEESKGVERRSQIDAETVKGLLAVNGGGAVAMLGFLQAIIDKPDVAPLVYGTLIALVAFPAGIVTALSHNIVRRECFSGSTTWRGGRNIRGLGRAGFFASSPENPAFASGVAHSGCYPSRASAPAALQSLSRALWCWQVLRRSH